VQLRLPEAVADEVTLSPRVRDAEAVGVSEVVKDNPTVLLHVYVGVREAESARDGEGVRL